MFCDMIRLDKFRVLLLFAVLTICGTASFASCSSNEENATEQSNITTIADKVWTFSQAHPDGTKAAQQGNADALYQLGKSYMKGKGVAADQKKATSWLKKAVKNEKGGKDILAKIRKDAADGDEDAKAMLHLIK